MDDPLLDKKIEYLIDIKVRKLAEELESANKTIAMLSEQVNILQNKVQRLNVGVVPVEAQTKLVADSGPSPVQTAAMSQEVNQENPKTQAFTPEDVSVEKIFYFGNK